MTQIITVAIEKGGTGKTTTALALAQAAAHRGYKVLAIDLDPQCNLSFALGADLTRNELNSYKIITDTAKPLETVQATEYGVHILPGSQDLKTIESGTGTARRLQKAIKKKFARLYDYIIIDTPPTGGELQYNALMAATGLIIPLEADIYNLQSLYQINDTFTEIHKANADLRILGCVLTQYDNRSNLAKQMRQTITEAAAALDIPYLGNVRKGIAVKEAAALQQSLFEYAPNSKPAQDYLLLFDTIKRED